MRIIIVGAGAAGLIAGEALSKKGYDVTIVEKNEKAGRKIFITGKGRCNLTNACPKKDLRNNIVNNGDFMLSSFSRFDNQYVMDYFSNLGVKLEIQRGNRVFPASLRSGEIIDALVNDNKKSGTKFLFNEEVISIDKKDEVFFLKTSKRAIEADKVIVATGGLSYPNTGSTGDGYRFASDFALNIIKPVPALCALSIKETIPHHLDGFILKNVTLKVNVGKKKLKEFGDLTFYDYGLAGPIALTLSSLINREKIEDVSLSLDLKPAMDEETLKQRIEREISSHKLRNVNDLLHSLLPMEFVKWFASLCSIDTFDSVYELTKEKRNKIIHALKNLAFSFNGLDDIKRATVTSGGVDVKEIDGRTMESKKVPGLYFIGEVLDVDAFTGGFNLQIAFSTGLQAAQAI